MSFTVYPQGGHTAKNMKNQSMVKVMCWSIISTNPHATKLHPDPPIRYHLKHLNNFSNPETTKPKHYKPSIQKTCAISWSKNALTNYHTRIPEPLGGWKSSHDGDCSSYCSDWIQYKQWFRRFGLCLDSIHYKWLRERRNYKGFKAVPRKKKWI